MKSRSPLLPPLETCTVAVIGLGYVGLPLAIEFSKRKSCVSTGVSLKRTVIGFDVNRKRLLELKDGYDRCNEISSDELSAAQGLHFTGDPESLAAADVFIVTVPTPIDSTKRPDLTPLEIACSTVGIALRERAKRGSTCIPVVIYESTVYPGATEEVCVPILEHQSGLIYNQGFACGYSPERINPGDSDHRITTITKVTSGSTPDVASWVDALYKSIIEAGTHLAPSLKVAEAAKVIENTQRDLNIALVNELAIIFSYMKINTRDVLQAASTKWNFLPFTPGLVGGHCIGVDPYYLTHKAEKLGYYPQVVLAGRRINDGMSLWVVQQLVLELARRGSVIAGGKVLVLGFSFKENCPDFRNTRVIDMLNNIEAYGMKPVVVDPWVDPEQALLDHGLNIKSEIPYSGDYKAVVLAVAHHQFTTITHERWRELQSGGAVLFDLKGIIPRELDTLRL